jgi:hypothetical protein
MMNVKDRVMKGLCPNSTHCRRVRVEALWNLLKTSVMIICLQSKTRIPDLLQVSRNDITNV